jgi:hypothetical protein
MVIEEHTLAALAVNVAYRIRSERIIERRAS